MLCMLNLDVTNEKSLRADGAIGILSVLLNLNRFRETQTTKKSKLKFNGQNYFQKTQIFKMI